MQKSRVPITNTLFLNKYVSKPLIQQEQQLNPESDFENLNEPGTDIGFHLLNSKSIQDDQDQEMVSQPCKSLLTDLLANTTIKLTEFNGQHPSLHISRQSTSDI